MRNSPDTQRTARSIVFAVLTAGVAATSVQAQDRDPLGRRSAVPPTAADSAAAFANAASAELFGRARDARARNDSAIRSYTAVVRTRIAVGLRMPLKDRTIFRKETAARARWSRDAPSVVQVLAARSQHPGGVETHPGFDGLGVDELFDPTADRLYFGMGGTRRDSTDADDASGSVAIARESDFQAANADSVRARADSTARPDSVAARPSGGFPIAPGAIAIAQTDSVAADSVAADSAQNTDVNADTADGGNISFWIEHPLGDAAERHYRFEIGDTITIRLQGGRELRVVELRITPRRDDPHTVTGTLWIEPEAGALVQGAFRLSRAVDAFRDLDMEDIDEDDLKYVPGFLKPIEFDAPLITVEYSLWELSHWLPRTMRTEAHARAGAVKFPVSYEISYDMEAVEVGVDSVGERARAREIAQQWTTATDSQVVVDRGRSGDYIVIETSDTMRLLESELLPAPIWTEEVGFMSNAELESIADRLASLTGAIHAQSPLQFGWGLGGRETLRYNRVEALSIGARASVGFQDLALTGAARIGVGDLHPNASLEATRESMRRTLSLRVYHELTTVDPERRALGFGNSVSSLLFGRDEGEYYRASGASIAWMPPAASRASWDLAAYAEYQNDARRETHFSIPRIWNDSVFRANIVAAEAMQYGGMIRLRPWWGTDPRRAQFGMDMMVRGETGDYNLATGSLTLRAAVPLGSRIRIAGEAAVGSSTGDVTPQRMFYLGGANTLRGYDPSTVAGTSMARARLEVGRTSSYGTLAVFSDFGWAGDRDFIREADTRWSVGIGGSMLDGLIRLDLAHGLRGPRQWRLDLHLDAIM